MNYRDLRSLMSLAKNCEAGELANNLSLIFIPTCVAC